MKILLTLLVFTITVPTPIFAQEEVFKVLFLDGSVSVNGETGIKVGANLYLGDTIELGPDGYIGLMHNTDKPMELKDSGKYAVEDLDEIVSNWADPPPPLLVDFYGLDKTGDINFFIFSVISNNCKNPMNEFISDRV